jgi:hypothetical protein
MDPKARASCAVKVTLAGRRGVFAPGTCAALALFACLSNCSDKTCSYGGKSYAAGETFRATDGCNSCSCDLRGGVACTLMGCTPPVDAGAPDAGPAACRSDSDCASGAGFVCVGPYQPFRCGPVLSGTVGQTCSDDANCTGAEFCRAAAQVDAGLTCSLDRSCTVDADCGPNRVCREDSSIPTGWIGTNGLACSVPCAASSDCPPTSACENGGHCRGRTCAECPSYFSCSNGACAIPSCSSDAQCPGGYCVRGACAGSLGLCRQLCL